MPGPSRDSISSLGVSQSIGAGMQLSGTSVSGPIREAISSRPGLGNSQSAGVGLTSVPGPIREAISSHAGLGNSQSAGVGIQLSGNTVSGPTQELGATLPSDSTLLTVPPGGIPTSGQPVSPSGVHPFGKTIPPGGIPLYGKTLPPGGIPPLTVPPGGIPPSTVPPGSIPLLYRTVPPDGIPFSGGSGARVDPLTVYLPQPPGASASVAQGVDGDGFTPEGHLPPPAQRGHSAGGNEGGKETGANGARETGAGGARSRPPTGQGCSRDSSYTSHTAGQGPPAVLRPAGEVGVVLVGRKVGP